MKVKNLLTFKIYPNYQTTEEGNIHLKNVSITKRNSLK